MKRLFSKQDYFTHPEWRDKVTTRDGRKVYDLCCSEKIIGQFPFVGIIENKWQEWRMWYNTGLVYKGLNYPDERDLTIDIPDEIETWWENRYETTCPGYAKATRKEADKVAMKNRTALWEITENKTTGEVKVIVHKIESKP